MICWAALACCGLLTFLSSLTMGPEPSDCSLTSSTSSRLLLGLSCRQSCWTVSCEPTDQHSHSITNASSRSNTETGYTQDLLAALLFAVSIRNPIKELATARTQVLEDNGMMKLNGHLHSSSKSVYKELQFFWSRIRSCTKRPSTVAPIEWAQPPCSLISHPKA